MGIVIKQSAANTGILIGGFGLGAINVLFLYTHFLSAEYFGLVTFLLSTANILMPILVYGMHHSIIKFYSSYKNPDAFMSATLWLPLIIILPVSFFFSMFYQEISNWISRENLIIKDYTWYILILGVVMGYFEVFFAWSRVQMKTVFGTFIREVFARACTLILLFAVYFDYLNPHEFVLGIVLVYTLRMVVMKLYAYYLYRPKWTFKLPDNFREVMRYATYIILAGSAGTILLEIDKFMIPQLEQIEQVAFYSVGIYIASVIGIPSRAMQQIVNPITAKALNEGNQDQVEDLYKKVSKNLLVIGGLLFLWINLGIESIYGIINQDAYALGIPVVLIISFAELFKLMMGNTNTVLTNSKHYKFYFYISLFMAISVIVLNRYFIAHFGILGAAFATLLVVLFSGLVKMLFLRIKMKLNLDWTQNLQILMLVFLLYQLFYRFWPELGVNDWFLLLIESSVIGLIYVGIVYWFRFSPELNKLLEKFVFNRK